MPMSLDLDLRTLANYTHLPFITECYFHMVFLNTVTKYGYTLAGTECFLDGLEIPVPHNVFWAVLSRLLMVQNELFYKRMSTK